MPDCGGKRGRSTDGLSLNDVALELVEDIDTAGMDGVVLVGHSQAGQAMALMAELRPSLFRRLVYVTCSIPSPGQSAQQMIGPDLRGTNPNEVGWPLDPKTTTMAGRYRIMFCNDMDRASGDAFPPHRPLATGERRETEIRAQLVGAEALGAVAA